MLKFQCNIFTDKTGDSNGRRGWYWCSQRNAHAGIECLLYTDHHRQITRSGSCVCGEIKCSCADVWQSPRLFIWCDRFVGLRAWFVCRGAGCLLFFCAQSHTKRGIELFPQIPDGEPAAFTRLRARGGLLISATREMLPLGGGSGGSGGMVVSNVTVTDARPRIGPSNSVGG
jgi:hypothetical protein